MVGYGAPGTLRGQRKRNKDGSRAAHFERYGEGAAKKFLRQGHGVQEGGMGQRWKCGGSR